jgi:hypothetical protein
VKKEELPEENKEPVIESVAAPKELPEENNEPLKESVAAFEEPAE